MSGGDEAIPAEYHARFDRTVQVDGIKIPKDRIQEVTRKYKDHRYGRKGVKPIVDCDDDHKIWLVADGKIGELTDLEGERVKVDVKLCAKHFSGYEIMKEVLLEGMTIPGSFETVGHIAHINLKEEHRKYRFFIGRVIIDKNPGVRTVVNKVESIGSQFREFKFELLAGTAEYDAVVKQHGCVFKFPYDKVYWNSRLQTEHARLVDECAKGDIVADVMAGVGPFVIPAAKKGLVCYGNDLNPESHKAMVENSKINHVTSKVTTSCLDGNAFIHHIRDTVLQTPGPTVHFIMNLPATAITFLPSFLSWPESTYSHRALVHVYCFSSSADFKAHSIEMVKEQLGEEMASKITEVSSHHVRNVAPKKEMLCVTFRLPKGAETDEHEAKKRKTDS
eukprot:TRINITY_DN3517_c0_g1_i2.p1 TRINITY_DN3517_c0_g1~~TRINITY_DN3517_c0_g1_i2.p1  ORF type:complete len:391 (+),score=128.88 TRINITY_DN3517_c0_g1_i2:43-1215(+)